MLLVCDLRKLPGLGVRLRAPSLGMNLFGCFFSEAECS